MGWRVLKTKVEPEATSLFAKRGSRPFHALLHRCTKVTRYKKNYINRDNKSKKLDLHRSVLLLHLP
jgi:hypothetical protein